MLSLVVLWLCDWDAASISLLHACDFWGKYTVIKTDALFSRDPQGTPVNYGAHFQEQVYPVSLLISSAFLFLTLLVHALVRELREDALAKSFMCSIGMLGLAQTLMVAGNWGAEALMRTPACFGLGEQRGGGYNRDVKWVYNYASPTSGEAYRDRRLTTNFELWVEIFMCRHVSMWGFQNRVCPSVRTPRKDIIIASSISVLH